MGMFERFRAYDFNASMEASVPTTKRQSSLTWLLEDEAFQMYLYTIQLIL